MGIKTTSNGIDWFTLSPGNAEQFTVATKFGYQVRVGHVFYGFVWATDIEAALDIARSWRGEHARVRRE